MPKGLLIEVGVQSVEPKTGKPLDYIEWREANSLLKAFAQILCAQGNQVAQTIKDTGGANQSVANNARNFLMNAGAGTTTLGIVIGTGTNAVTAEDYQLQTQVTASWVYGASIEGVENPATGVWRFTTQRMFTNNTGGSVTIREIGLYCGIIAAAIACIDRTLRDVVVANGAAKTITYRITVGI